MCVERLQSECADAQQAALFRLLVVHVRRCVPERDAHEVSGIAEPEGEAAAARGPFLPETRVELPGDHADNQTGGKECLLIIREECPQGVERDEGAVRCPIYLLQELVRGRL